MPSQEELLSEIEVLRQRVAELEQMSSSTSPLLRLQPLFEHTFEGIQILDHHYRYVYINRRAAEHGRKQQDQLLGKKMIEIYPGIEQTEMFEHLQHCMQHRTHQQMINHFAYPDGRKAWFDLRMSPVPAGVLIFSVDITEQKTAEEVLRQSEENLALSLECMVDGLLTTDLEGRITAINPAAESLTGWSKAEALGEELESLVHFLDQDSRQPVEHVVEKVLRDGVKIGLANHTLLVNRAGKEIPISSSGAALRDASGGIRGAVIVLKSMQKEYELSAMLQQAQKMEALGRLAGGVAHDFNNLLTIICGYSEMILDALPAGSSDFELLQQIEKAGKRAAALTHQLLIFSRQEALAYKPVDINQSVREAEQMLGRVIGEDIEVMTRLAPNLGQIKADPSQLQQVIVNLAVNARDAMPQGGNLTLETRPVSVASQLNPGDVPPGDYLLLSVRDSGCGMDSATQARIFEPFFTTKRAGKGTGLGLATVFGIVKQSGGHLQVHSQPGKGSCFEIYLPVISEKVSPAPAAAPQGSLEGQETVLLVEDDEGVRTFMVMSLELFGYQVLEAKDGESAIALASSHGGPIELLISDVILPGMGGREVAELVSQQHPQIKVLYLSGYTDDAVMRQGILQSETAFLQKPFRAEVLARKVREVLSPQLITSGSC